MAILGSDEEDHKSEAKGKENERNDLEERLKFAKSKCFYQ
jgi:hypothetical protein